MKRFMGRSGVCGWLAVAVTGVFGCGGGGGGTDTTAPKDPGVTEDVSTGPDVPVTDPGGGDTGLGEDPGGVWDVSPD